MKPLVIKGAAKREAKRGGMRLTPRQLFIGLAAAGFVSDEEAIAAATLGTMPASVEAAIAGLSQAKQTEARITWARMSVVQRTDPLVALIAARAGKTEAEIDEFFETFATI